VKEFSYVATSNTVWTCANCNCYITSEESTGWFDQNGKPVSIFTPSSRYWAPGSKPPMTTAVYCRVECVPKANNENPVGL